MIPVTSPNRSTADEPLDAGRFGPWLDQIQGAIRGEHGSDVPCGSCTACCTSSQFVHIAPHETDALAHIPNELLFPAPRAPKGHVLMGYDQNGRCPMLIDDRCSIYEHRPMTCRTYDCRIFTAAGVSPADDPDKRLIAERVERWRFDAATEDESADDAVRRAAVRAAARFIGEHADQLPADLAPVTTTQLAIAAVAGHSAFVGVDPTSGRRVVVEPEVAAVRNALSRDGSGRR